jgi:Trypsin
MTCHQRVAVVVLSIVAQSACTPGGTPPGPSTPTPIKPQLVGGVASFEQPAAGWVGLAPSGMCTGTLVAGRLVVTAAHCYGWTNVNTDSNLGSFNMTQTDGMTNRSEKVLQVRSYGTSLGKDDVAFAVLEHCADDFAKPLAIAAAFPAQGSSIDKFGYGCQSKLSWCEGGSKPLAPWPPLKQKVTEKLGQDTSDCAGDSGGPYLSGGTVFGVMSGGWPCSNSPDVAGDVTTRQTQLDGLLVDFGCPGDNTSSFDPDAGPNVHVPIHGLFCSGGSASPATDGPAGALVGRTTQTLENAGALAWELRSFPKGSKFRARFDGPTLAAYRAVELSRFRKTWNPVVGTLHAQFNGNAQGTVSITGDDGKALQFTDNKLRAHLVRSMWQCNQSTQLRAWVIGTMQPDGSMTLEDYRFIEPRPF